MLWSEPNPNPVSLTGVRVLGIWIGCRGVAGGASGRCQGGSQAGERRQGGGKDRAGPFLAKAVRREFH